MPVRQIMRTTSLLALAIPAVAVGPEWPELGDAGPLPDTAQTPLGTGPLTKIRGELEGLSPAGADFQDMYRIRINDPAAFRATLDPGDGGFAGFDTELYLFTERSPGFALGLLANDDKTTAVSFSEIGDMATDGTGATVFCPDDYLLVIAGFDSEPESLGGFIFLQATPTEVSGPDGSGGSMPLFAWPLSGATGRYEIVLEGASFVTCLEDIDSDGVVGFADVLRVLTAWGPCPQCPEDLDCDLMVGFSDLLLVLGAWGPCP